MSDPRDYFFEDAAHEDGDMFRRPVPVPIADVDAPNLVCFAVNEEYAAIIALALQRLTYHDAWSGSETDIARACRQFEHLIGRLLVGECLDDGCQQPQEPQCVEISAYHPALGYFPNHPILTPDYVHPGYSAPAWITNTLIPGYLPTDVLFDPFSIDLFASLADLLNSGVPSWTLHFSGSGEIDVTFLTQVQGGMVWLFPDGNPLVGTLVDLNWRSLDDFDSTDLIFELIGILTAPANVFERTQSITFATEGPHTLTAWYLPVGDLDPPFIFAGGGIRNIQLCGDIELNEDAMPAFDLNLDGCSLSLRADMVVVDSVDLTQCILDAVALRDNNCQLEQFDGEEWQPIAGANYFKTTADCAITGRVELHQNTAPLMEAIQYRNFLHSPGENSSIRSEYLMLDNGGVERRVSGDLLGWRDKAADQTYRSISLWQAGIERTAMQIGFAWALRVYAYSVAGQADGLQINMMDHALGSARGLGIFNTPANRYMTEFLNNGQANLQRFNNPPNARADALTLSAFTPNSPTGGYGLNLVMRAKSSTTENRNVARIGAFWGTAADATRKGAIDLEVYDETGPQRFMTATATTNGTAIGFNGSLGQVKPTIAETDIVSAVNAILNELDGYGLITNQSALSPILDELTDIRGDRNLAPEIVLDECRAANGIAFMLHDDMAILFTLDPYTTEEIYHRIRLSHGMNVKNAWELATIIDGYSLAERAAIQVEWTANYADIIPLIKASLYDQSAIQIGIANFGFTPNTENAYFALVSVYTKPTWDELVFTASETADELYSCALCDPPQEGNDWAIEWDLDTLELDWSIAPGGCGSGLDLQFNCPSSGQWRIDLRYTPGGPPATSYQFTYWSVTAAHNLDDFWGLDGALTSIDSGLLFDPVSMQGSGETSNETSGLTNGGNDIAVNVDVFASGGTFDSGDTISITKLRIEGTGIMPPHNGVSC